MAFDAFFKIDGVDGESTDKDHKGEIDVLSFSWGEANAVSSSGGGGAGAGKVSFQDLHFTSSTSKASPALMLACASGKHISNATLTLRKKGGKQNEFLVIKLTDVFVSSYQTGGTAGDQGDTLPTDDVSLNFAKIEVDYTPDQGPTVKGTTSR